MSDKRPLRKEVYWAKLDPVEGSEQGGFRPVFIVSNKLMNKSAPIVIGIPMTRSGETAKNYPFNIKYHIADISIDDDSVSELKKLGHSFVKENGSLLCNQARAFSKTRLVHKIGNFINEEKVKEIEEAIIHSFGLNACKSCDTPLRPGGLKCSNPGCKKTHSKKCFECKKVNPIEFNFCTNCGRRVR